MKKFLSGILALAMCISLAIVPVSAVVVHAPQDMDLLQDSHIMDWGSGPRLTANRVVSKGGIAIGPDTYAMLWVIPGGGFTLEMPFPTANRQYTIDLTGIYLPNSHKDGVWGNFTDRIVYTKQDGKSSYSFACTSDMAGNDRLIRVSVTWADVDGTRILNSGDASFYIEVETTTSFTDVRNDAYYAKAVAWAVEKGITTGTSQTTFSPGSTCTTAHILTFLWRGAGRPGASGENMSRNDELAAVTAWARTKGITVPGNLNTACTRASAVTYMWRAAGSPAPQSTASFTDVPASADYAKAVSWALEKGITSGTGSTTFSPGQSCNRGQIVTFLYRQDVEPLTPSTPSAAPSNPTSNPANPDGSISIRGVMLLRTSVELAASTPATRHASLTQLAVGSDWTQIHGQNYTFEWSVDNPSVVQIEKTVVNGYQAVSITSTSTPGSAVITCTVTGEDGHRDSAYCHVTVTGGSTSTPSTSSTPSTPSGPMTAEQMCARVVELVNQERAKQGLPALSTMSGLTAAANIRAPELAVKFSHDRPDGTQCFTALRETRVSGYFTAGENIASGQSTPESVMNDWMNSPGHRANILESDFTHIGVAYYNNYWVQMFIGKR